MEDLDKADLDVRENDSFNKFWGWFGTIVYLAQEDITKMDQITEYPLIFVLNYMSYMKDLNELRERERKKLEAKYKRL